MSQYVTSCEISRSLYFCSDNHTAVHFDGPSSCQPVPDAVLVADYKLAAIVRLDLTSREISEWVNCTNEERNSFLQYYNATHVVINAGRKIGFIDFNSRDLQWIGRLIDVQGVRQYFLSALLFPVRYSSWVGNNRRPYHCH